MRARKGLPPGNDERLCTLPEPFLCVERVCHPKRFPCGAGRSAVLDDAQLTPPERQFACMRILYPDWRETSDWGEAFRAAMQFVNCGKPVPENQPPKPKLVDWEKDAEIYRSRSRCSSRISRADAASICIGGNSVGAYSNIGRGLFAEVVNIRSKRVKGKPLEKYEKEFVREHPDLVNNITSQLTAEEEEFFKRLGV